MGTQDEGVGVQMDRIKKAFEHATKIADAVFPEPVDQGTAREFSREGLSCAVESMEEVLSCYAVPFQKKALQIVMDNFPAKEIRYEQEVRRQTADDELLDVTSSWPVERLENLLITLKEGTKNG